MTRAPDLLTPEEQAVVDEISAMFKESGREVPIKEALPFAGSMPPISWGDDPAKIARMIEARKELDAQIRSIASPQQIGAYETHASSLPALARLKTAAVKLAKEGIPPIRWTSVLLNTDKFGSESTIRKNLRKLGYARN